MTAWTQSEDDKIKELLQRGNSFGVIGKVLNRTRNSVIGRAHRLGLAKFVPEEKLAEIEAKEEAIIKAPQKVEEPIVEGPTIVELSHSQCLFSVGRNRNGELTFCGEPIQINSRYCADHHRIAYVKGARQ